MEGLLNVCRSRCRVGTGHCDVGPSCSRAGSGGAASSKLASPAVPADILRAAKSSRPVDRLLQPQRRC